MYRKKQRRTTSKKQRRTTSKKQRRTTSKKQRRTTSKKQRRLATKKQRRFVRELPKSIKESIMWYVYEGTNFNRKVRRGEKLTSEEVEHVKNIDIAFAGVPPLEESITVFRGIGSRNVLYSDKTYISTSTDRSLTFRFTGPSGCCLLEIIVARGSKILTISEIFEHGEEEILLDKDAIMIVTDRKIKKGRETLYCTYSAGVVLESEKDINFIEKQLVVKDKETKIIATIVKVLRNQDWYAWGEDELEELIYETYDKLYPDLEPISEEMLDRIFYIMY